MDKAADKAADKGDKAVVDRADKAVVDRAVEKGPSLGILPVLSYRMRLREH